MKTRFDTRRTLLAGMAGVMGTSVLAGPVAASVLTPRAAEGPYYPQPSMRMPDIDNDLVNVAGAVEKAGGEIVTLRGRTISRNGEPLAGHRIEIWQCDVNGRYLHPRDNRDVPYDHAFQGFGHDITDETGAFVFRTIKPTVYPGRTPHIHVKVLDGDRDLLTTQFYIKDHPMNGRDWLFRRMSDAEADAVSMDFMNSGNGPEATVTIIL